MQHHQLTICCFLQPQHNTAAEAAAVGHRQLPQPACQLPLPYCTICMELDACSCAQPYCWALHNEGELQPVIPTGCRHQQLPCSKHEGSGCVVLVADKCHCQSMHTLARTQPECPLLCNAGL
jgi:hypothetical protein